MRPEENWYGAVRAICITIDSGDIDDNQDDVDDHPDDLDDDDNDTVTCCSTPFRTHQLT